MLLRQARATSFFRPSARTKTTEMRLETTSVRKGSRCSEARRTGSLLYRPRARSSQMLLEERHGATPRSFGSRGIIGDRRRRIFQSFICECMLGLIAVELMFDVRRVQLFLKAVDLLKW